MNRLAILALPILVSGCGIPPAVTIATYAMDGAVWAASGKTVRDHALSAVVEQDCSMFRVISGNPVCTDYQPNDAAAAALETMPASEEMLATTPDGRVIRVATTPARDVTTDGPMVAENGGADPTRQPTPAPSRDAALHPSLATSGERTLITTEDGREIRVAAPASSAAANNVAPAGSTMLSWVPPALGAAATR